MGDYVNRFILLYNLDFNAGDQIQIDLYLD